MASLPVYSTALSSLILRLAAYIFLRWIPGHHAPPIVLLSAVIYFSSFILTLLSDLELPAIESNNGVVVKTNGITMKSSKGEGKYLIKRTELEHTVDLVGKEEAEEQRIPPILQTLMLGLPNYASPLWSFITAAINVILLLAVGDLVFRAPLSYPSQDISFARVGFVSDTSANILLREPCSAQLPIYISYRSAPIPGEPPQDDSWKAAGQVYLLSNKTDYTHALTVRHLRPSTRYQYAISNNHTGFFRTASPSSQTPSENDKFTFLTSSCIKPHFPYNPFSHPLSIPGFRHLATWIPSLHASFMLFLGDFIYVDVPRRFGTDIETYRREYRQVYASPDWPSVSSSLPWLHVLDDHEIANDWDANTTAPYPAAVDPWHLYHASVNPPPARPNASYFQFTQGPASFFLLDTRRYRTPEHAAEAKCPTKSMLGRDQLSSLLTFLSRPESPGVKWKIIASSVPFTRNWRFGSADTWAGYLHERQIVLDAMWDVGARGDGVGVVVLSGDRHEFAATAFPPPKGGKWPLSATVHEFSTSPLSMFYLPVRTYWEVEGEDDMCIKYVPDGNSKFGAVELSGVKGGEQGILKFRLFVDGIEKWDYVLTTPPTGVEGGRRTDAVKGGAMGSGLMD